MLLAFHKPYGVLSQFTEEVAGQRVLAEFGFPPKVYPLGRLDADSEGLLLLSDEAGLNNKLLDPKRKHGRRYHVQVEGEASEEALRKLGEGVLIQGRLTLPARAWRLENQAPLPERNPPVRFRKHIPTTWIAVELTEGRNRQVRKMTAAVGLPTLRLFRAQIGGYEMPVDLGPGQWRELSAAEWSLVFAG